ncbi:MAG: DUF4920 domain-containing protein [Planctomycetota bacterium]
MKFLQDIVLLVWAIPACAIVGLATVDMVSAEAPATQPASVQSEPYIDYGEPVAGRDDVDPGSVSDILDDPDAYLDQTVRLRGVVQKVCKKRGCWMQLGDPELGSGLFVKFTCPIEGRLIPMEAIGKTAEVFGELRVVEISEARARHYAEDDGKSPEEIAKIVGPQKMVTVASPSARVFGLMAEGE